MIRRTVAAAAGAAIAVFLTASGASAGCTLNSVSVPVEMHGLRPMVAAKINGQAVKLLVDSGAFFNSVSGKFAAAQKLKPVEGVPTGSHIPAAVAGVTSGAAGKPVLTGLVVAAKFEFAGLAVSNVPFLAEDRFDEAAGILGQNFLHTMDVDYDLRQRVIRLAFPKDCKEAVLAYWVQPGQAYNVMPLDPPEPGNEHTQGEIWINGVKMRALFDTGASSSFITRRAAARAGVKVTDPGVRAVGEGRGVDADIKAWVARFASVKVGDEEIKNGLLSIGQSEARDFDVLIGADFFLSHRVFVANSQRRLYFTYEGGQVFSVASEGGQAAGQGSPPKPGNAAVR